ncbi:MAG: hypothetical protein HYT71_01130 [Candidatus Aenigmarchaeota archaeon]|nr:hypothetical protein [Candidatus Aenigmarchaeota archaeon]
MSDYEGEGNTIKLWLYSVAAVVLLLFLLVNGPKGILDAFSTLTISTGLFIIFLLFFRADGNENVGLGLAISSVLIVGGFLVSSSTGFTSIAMFLAVFSSAIIFVYGLAPKNNPDKHVIMLTIAAVVIIFFGGGSIPVEMSLTVTGVLLLIITFGVIFFLFSKFSDEKSGMKWAVFLSTLMVVFGILYLFAGFLPGFAFSVLVIFAFAASKIFPESGTESGVVSWVGTGSAILVIFFLASAQGLFPGLLRAFSLVILASGVITIWFFFRVGEKEIAGITSSGLLLGTILTLVGLYLTLF